MAKLRQKKRLRALVNSKVVLVLLLILCIPLLMSVYKRFQVEREMAARLYEAQEELNELLERKESLESRVEYLKDDRGVEAEVRRHFDVAKAGEQVVIILDDKEKIEREIATTSVSEAITPWYLFWKE